MDDDDVERVMDDVERAKEETRKVGGPMVQNLLELYVLAERMWKIHNEDIINAGNHLCDPDRCTMLQLKVVLFEKQADNAFENAFHLRMDKERLKKQGAFVSEERLREQLKETAAVRGASHLCIPSICPCLQPGHECEKPADCRKNQCVHVDRYCDQNAIKQKMRAAAIAEIEEAKKQGKAYEPRKQQPPMLLLPEFERGVHCGKRDCLHIFEGATCRQPAVCPHSLTYLAHERRELKDFWVCKQTGSVHICGENCTQRKIQTQRELHIICALTRAFVRSTLVHADAWKLDTANNVNKSLFLTGDDSPLLLTDKMAMDLVCDDTSKAKRIKTAHASSGVSPYSSVHSAASSSSSAASSSMTGILVAAPCEPASLCTPFVPRNSLPPWERPNEIALNTAIAKMLFKELMFSETRQALEIDAVINSRQQMFKETHKMLRHRKIQEKLSGEILEYSQYVRSQCGGDSTTVFTEGKYSVPTVATVALTTIASTNTRSQYFMHVPVQPQLVALSKKRLDDVNSRYLVGRSDPLPNPAQQRERARRLAAHEARCDSLIRSALRTCGGFSENDDDDDDDGEQGRYVACEESIALRQQQLPFLTLDWESKEWKDKMERITDLVARVTVRVWLNLNRYCVDWQTTRTEINFKRIILPLMYMLRRPLTYKSQNIGGIDTTERMPQVVIIPRIDFTDLLPVESNVTKFKITDFCTPSSKTITPIQTLIQQYFYTAAQTGRIHDVRIRLSSF